MRRLGIFLIAAAAGCQNEPSAPQPIICPTVINYGINVFPEDALSGAHAPFTDVSVTAVEKQYRDSVHVNVITDSMARIGSDYVGLALGRPGTYTVTVTASGYKKWTVSGFKTVLHFQCLGASDIVVARLQRQ